MSGDDEEIRECFGLVLRGSWLGLVYESVDVNWVISYMRSWFVWVNGVFVEMVLDLVRRKFELIFEDGRLYEIL